MIRSFGFVSLLAALAIGGYLVSAQWRSAGPTSPTASTAIAAAGGEVATLNLQQAALALEQFRAESGSYAGAALGGFGRLRDFGVLEHECDEVAQLAAARPGAKANPRPASAEEIAELLRSIW